MVKRRTFKKTKPGEPIPVTARQLESFMLEHNGRFNSRDYDKFERMELKCMDNGALEWSRFRFGNDSIITSFRYQKQQKPLEDVAKSMDDYHVFVEVFCAAVIQLAAKLSFQNIEIVSIKRAVRIRKLATASI